MYLPGQWYRLRPRKLIDSKDPVSDLDVTILSESILQPVLKIGDLRKSERIDFVVEFVDYQNFLEGLILEKWQLPLPYTL